MGYAVCRTLLFFFYGITYPAKRFTVFRRYPVKQDLSLKYYAPGLPLVSVPALHFSMKVCDEVYTLNTAVVSPIFHLFPMVAEMGSGI